MPLIQLLRSSKNIGRSKTAVQKAVDSVQYVNSKDLKPIGITKPMCSPGIIRTIKPSVVVTELNNRDYSLLIASYLTKHPHYVFKCKVKSGETNRVQFWFLDTKRKVTVIMKYKEMREELTRSLPGFKSVVLREQGFEPKPDEVYIPKYCIWDKYTYTPEEVLRYKYKTYKLQKYNTLTPFDTDFPDLSPNIKELFDYKTEVKEHRTESEVSLSISNNATEEIPTILGETGTGLIKVGNGYKLKGK